MQDHKQLVEYVSSELKLGVEENKIRLALSNTGWPSSEIDLAFSETKQSHLSSANQLNTISYKSKTILCVLLVLILLGSISLFVYIKFGKSDSGTGSAQITDDETKYPFDLVSKRFVQIDPSIDQSTPIHIAMVSNDGKHLAYLVYTQQGQQIVVVDGEKSNEYKMIKDLTTGKDGNLITYIGYRLKKEFVVRGTEEDRPYEHIFSGPIISDDENHFAYVAEKIKFTASSTERNHVLVVNNKEVHFSDVTGILATPRFSPDNTKVVYTAYTATENQKEFLVTYDLVSGAVIEGKKYENILGNPIFSQGGRLAYRVSDAGQEFIVIGTEEGTKFPKGEGAWEPVFSPDGKHIAVALDENKNDGSYSVILDDRRLLVHDISYGSTFPKFSEDSKRLSYEAGKKLYTYDIEQEKYISEEPAIDELEEYMKRYEGLMKKYGEPIQEFTDPFDNKYTVYAFLDQESMDEDEMKSINESNFYTKAKHRVVLSEVAQIVADQIYNPKFSADGKYLTLVALRDGEIWWEVYSFQNGNLEKMKSEDGYIIDRSTDAKEVYPTDEDGEIKGAPSEQEFEIEVLKETNIISLQLDFTGKKGSKALFSASIDDKMIGTIYEGDVEEGLQTYTFSFPSVSPGMHMFKIHVEPLNKNVRSGINMPSVVPGFKE